MLVELADASRRVEDRLQGVSRVRRGDRWTWSPRRPAGDALLLDAALRDGRVLVDRDGRWPSLPARRAQTARAAARAADELHRELHASVSELSSDA